MNQANRTDKTDKTDKTDNASKGRKARNIRNIIIEPFKQFKLGVYVLAACLAFIVITSWMVYSAFSEQYQQVMTIFGIVDQSNKYELIVNDVFLGNAMRLTAFFISFIGLIFYVVFRATHKFYGPLIGIRRFVKEIVRGDYTQRIVIRRGDELHDLVLKLNEMAETLEKRHGSRVGGVPERRKGRGEDKSETDGTDHQEAS